MKTIVATLSLSAIIVLVAGLFVIQAGLFNVSTTWKDPALLRWLLVSTREQSIEHRAAGIEVPDLDDEEMVARASVATETCVRTVMAHRGAIPRPWHRD